MATKVNQWLEGFNKVFVVPKRFKYIEDKLHNVKRSESELRILTGEEHIGLCSLKPILNSF